MITNKTTKASNPYLLMAVLIILWGSFSAVSKLVLTNLDSFQVQFYMFGLAAIIMTAIMGANGKLGALRTLGYRDLFRLLLYALPSFLYYSLYTLSLKLIPAIEASMLNYLFPIMIVIFAIPINKEKINSAKLLSILLGFAGTLIIITNGNFQNLKLSNLYGDLLAVIAAVCWGIFSNLGKKNKVDQVLSNYIYIVVSFVLSSVLLLLFSKPVIPDPAEFSGILWIGLSNIVIAYYLWFRVLKATSSALAASLSFITPFVTLAFIMLLLGEKITMVQIAGFLIIILGIASQNLMPRRDSMELSTGAKITSVQISENAVLERRHFQKNGK